MQAVWGLRRDKSDNGKQKIQGKVIALQQGSNKCFLWDLTLEWVHLFENALRKAPQSSDH